MNARENRRGNQEWTVQGYSQHWTHYKQDDDNKKKTTQKTKKVNNTDPNQASYTIKKP